MEREYDWSKTRIGVLHSRLKAHRNKTALVVSNYDLHSLLKVADLAASIYSASPEHDISKEIALLKQEGEKFYESYSDDLPPLEQTTDLLTDVTPPHIVKAIMKARHLGGTNVGNATFHLSTIDSGVQKIFKSTVTIKDSATIDTLYRDSIEAGAIEEEEGIKRLKFSILNGIYGSVVDALVSLRELLVEIALNVSDPSGRVAAAINYCNAIIHMLEKGW